MFIRNISFKIEMKKNRMKIQFINHRLKIQKSTVLQKIDI